MLERNREVIKILRKPEIMRKERLGLSPNQTFLSRFIRRSCKQTEIHKKMKEIVVSELIKNEVNIENILIEKKTFKWTYF